MQKDLLSEGEQAQKGENAKIYSKIMLKMIEVSIMSNMVESKLLKFVTKYNKCEKYAVLI